MYLKHFNLECMPFEIGPDPKFLWLGSKHQEAFAILHYGIIERKGFVLIAGEPGTGKSTLLNAAIASFDQEVKFAKICEPALNTMDFVNFAADAFDMGQSFSSKGEFLIQLKRFVREAGTQRLALVIDEAQRVSPEMLEQIRIFSDVDVPGHRAFSCIFAGQPEFLESVKQNRALCQRVFFSHMLQSLTPAETGEYIKHRLKIAGCNQPLFTPAAIEEIFDLSKGNPRLINILCDQALLTAYASLRKEIVPEMIREGTESTLIPLQTAAEPVPVKLEPPAAITGPAPQTDNSAATPPSAGIKRSRAYFQLAAAAILIGLLVFFYRVGGLDWVPTPVISAPNAGIEQQSPPEGGPARPPDQKGAPEAQLREMRAFVAKLENELRQLQGASERAAEHERTLAQNEVTISELRHKLELAGASQSSASRELENLQKDNTRLQAQLGGAKQQQSSIEARLVEEQKIRADLSDGARSLRDAVERVARLEATISENNRKMAQLEQSSAEISRVLSRERNAKEQANSELSANQAAVLELTRKLEAAKSQQLDLEAEVAGVRSGHTRPQAQSEGAKGVRQTSTGNKTPPRQATVEQTPPQDETAGPNPIDVIDYVFNRKKQ